MIKVLAYHRVNNTDADPLTVKTETFLRQLDCLEDLGFDFVSPQAILDKTCEKTSVLLTFDHGFRTDYEVIYPLLKAKKYPAIFFLITDMIGKKDMLGFEDIRSLRKSGFNLGSHTISHPRLTRISLKEAGREISESKKILEDRVGEKIDYFSYPFGDMNEDIIKIVKEAGYKAAFFISRWKTKGKFSEFAIPRCGIYQRTNFLLFRLKML